MRALGAPVATAVSPHPQPQPHWVARSGALAETLGWSALAQALMPLIEDNEVALAALEPYKATYAQAMLATWRAKLGLQSERDEDSKLADDLLRLMATHGADFGITFRRLTRFDSTAGARNDDIRDLFVDREAFDAWALRYAERLRAESVNDADRAQQMMSHSYNDPRHAARTTALCQPDKKGPA